MIPKIIHYCWFGDAQFPSLVLKCISSWKKHLPEYEFIEWNETTFPINEFQFAKEAMEKGKFAFVADICRLYALKNTGGIYMDTDVELLKPLTPLLNSNAFCGFESEDLLATCLMASEKNGKWVNEILDYYIHRSFIKENGEIDIDPNTYIITQIMKENGLIMNNSFQEITNYLTIFPKDYFSPKDYNTKRIKLTSNTYCIHHFATSWKPWKEKYWHIIKWKFMNTFGYRNTHKLIEFIEGKK